MEKIKHITSPGYNYPMARQPETWCMVFFTTGFACDVVENGISECFSSMIRYTKKKPILIMIEEIMIYLMERFYHQGDLSNH